MAFAGGSGRVAVADLPSRHHRRWSGLPRLRQWTEASKHHTHKKVSRAAKGLGTGVEYSSVISPRLSSNPGSATAQTHASLFTKPGAVPMDGARIYRPPDSVITSPPDDWRLACVCAPVCLGARAVRLNTAKSQALNKRRPLLFHLSGMLIIPEDRTQHRTNPLCSSKAQFRRVKSRGSHPKTTVAQKHATYAPMQITKTIQYSVSIFALKQRAN